MDIKGKICIITGATSGIGKAAALELAERGVVLILPSRNEARGQQVKKELIEKAGNRNIEVFLCDLASFNSIRAFVRSFLEKYHRLHLLINNAGVWESKRRLSEDGIEYTWAVNHLAPFLLTELLTDALRAGAPSRIINVSSDAHFNGNLNFDDLEGEKSFNGFKAYSQSKLANILFTKELAQRLSGTGVTANSVMPGVIATAINRNLPRIARTGLAALAKESAKGAETILYLATADEISTVTGRYFKDKRIAESSPQSNDMAAARKLWEVSLDYLKRRDPILL